MDPNTQNQLNQPVQAGVPTFEPPANQQMAPQQSGLPQYQMPQPPGPQQDYSQAPMQPQVSYPQQMPAPAGQPMPQNAVQGANLPGQPPAPAKVVVKSNPNSTQNSLHIAEVRDGIVIMDDGTYRAVVMCKSINFDLMSPQEREAVEFSYQGFLNSLYFPIQIFIRSQRVDLGPYIEKLDKIRSEHDNMLLALLMEDYVNFMDQISQQTNIMDKKFYVVVPFIPVVDTQKAVQASKGLLGNLLGKNEDHVTINESDLEQAKTELRNRVQAVMQGLQQAGVQSLPLDTQELIELYYDAYNPDTATRQQLKNFGDLTAPVISKGEGVANQPHLNRELE